MKVLLFLPLFILFTSCQADNPSDRILVIEISPIDSIDIAPLGVLSINGLAASDSAFYLASKTSKSVTKTSRRFVPISTYAKNGSGPMEINEASDITLSEQRVYVIDFNQRKLVEFTHDLVPVDEFISEKPPFSILSVSDRTLWLGSFDMLSEDVYLLDFSTKSMEQIGDLVKTRYPMEGIVSHVKNDAGVVLRYRQFNHRLDVFRANGTQITFVNPTRPERPELSDRISSYPVFGSKIHHSGFVTPELACVLSGDHTPGHQPMQCFDFDGVLVTRYMLKQDPSMISVYSDSTLYTYSPKTNHIYVYSLGF